LSFGHSASEKLLGNGRFEERGGQGFSGSGMEFPTMRRGERPGWMIKSCAPANIA